MGKDSSVSRYLHPVERVVIQGFRPVVCAGLTGTQTVKAAGNSWTVPVVAHLLCSLLQVIIVIVESLISFNWRRSSTGQYVSSKCDTIGANTTV